MEVRNSTTLESCGEDSILFETMKSIVKREGRNELGSEEDFFLVSQVPEEQYSNASIEAATQEKLSETEGTFEWTELCRICANANDHLIPIYEGEGAEHDLSSKILKYLPIHISESDMLPLQLCYHCAATLLAWHELSEGCLNAERRLLEIQELLQNKRQHYDATSLDTMEISTSITAATAISPNMTIAQTDQQENSKDSACDAEEVNKSNRLKSQVAHDRRVVLSNSRKARKVLAQDGRGDSAQVKTSNAIEENLRDVPSIKDHIVTNKSAKQSLQADDTPVNARSLDKSTDDGKRESHEDPEPIENSATSCAREVKDEHVAEEREVKARRKTGNQPKHSEKSTSTHLMLVCKCCSKKFRSRKSYRAHTRTHTGEKSYTCHVCGKQFVQGGSLYYHLKHVHDGVKNHACDICGRSFAMKTAMEDHRRIHTGERPYVCHTCGKTFKTKASLYIHGKTHTDEFPHRCVYCAKRFRWRQQMLGHLTVHTGEKNHTCDICGKAFGVKNDLTRHKRVHSGEKPYKCQQCGISFGQKRYLKSHERLTHA